MGQVTSGCPSLLHAASHSSQPEFCLSGCLSSECPPTFCCLQSPKPPSNEGWRGSLGSGVWPQTRECTLKGRASRGGFPSLKRPSEPSDAPQPQSCLFSPHHLVTCEVSREVGVGDPLKKWSWDTMWPWCCRPHPDTCKFTPNPREEIQLVGFQLRELGTGA
ncbi:hypothetical protein K5549_002973 [Capra hircus]|nr:hypothetical protein K5549_002973 [Capra hircus]